MNTQKEILTDLIGSQIESIKIIEFNNNDDYDKGLFVVLRTKEFNGAFVFEGMIDGYSVRVRKLKHEEFQEFIEANDKPDELDLWSLNNEEFVPDLINKKIVHITIGQDKEIFRVGDQTMSADLTKTPFVIIESENEKWTLFDQGAGIEKELFTDRNFEFEDTFERIKI